MDLQICGLVYGCYALWLVDCTHVGRGILCCVAYLDFSLCGFEHEFRVCFWVLLHGFAGFRIWILLWDVCDGD